MDVITLTRFLAPFLPFLMQISNKAAESAAQKFGEDSWQKAKGLWAKLHPKVEAKEAAQEAASDLAQNPEDEDLQTALRLQLKKILESDSRLKAEIAKILEKESELDVGGTQINMSANAHDQSTLKQVGEIKADTVNF